MTSCIDKILAYCLVAILLASSVLSASSQAFVSQVDENSDHLEGVDVDIQEANPSNPFIIERSDRDQMIITLQCNELKQDLVEIEGQEYVTYYSNDFTSLLDVGKPQLPMTSRMLAMPNLDFEIEVLEESYSEDRIGQVMPAQEALPDNGAEPAGFVIDEALYSTDAYYPSEPYAFIEQGKMRSVPFTRLAFYPVQYNPVSGLVKVYNLIQVRITWGPESKAFDRIGQTSHYFDTSYSSMLANWEQFEPYFGPEEYPSPSYRTRGANGCEYLIITHPDFLPAAEHLGDWKNEMGIDTKVVTTDVTGTTSTQIKNYVQNAYDTWSPAPSYLLLVGDAEFVPTNYQNIHPYDDSNIGTDLWYTTLDGGDYYPDIYCGRIPVDTLAQAKNYINREIEFQRNPTNSSSYYNSATVAAYFQDNEPNGYESRRFVLTSEEIRDYLLTQGYTVDRIYVLVPALILLITILAAMQTASPYPPNC